MAEIPSPETMEQIKRFQRNEITEHFIYKKLAKKIKDNHPENSKVLEQIAEEELEHYNVWKSYTGIDIEPDMKKVKKYITIAKIFGLTFALKLMENGEESAQENYSKLSKEIPDAVRIMEDEDRHEQEILAMIEEEKIGYISSMVLGLSDAIVELTGTLAGLTFALQNSQLVGLAGLITGIAASLSMASSEYLSQKSEKSLKNPLKASIYTGGAYIVTVAILIAPFFIFSSPFFALGVAGISVIFVIAVFTFFMAVVKDLSFKKSFAEMVIISFSVMAISFVIGLAARKVLGIDIS